MEIQFIKESDKSYSAISQNVLYNGVMCDELLWGELDQEEGGSFIVRFEDSYNVIHRHPDLESTKKFVLDNYFKHTPYINGLTYEIEE